MSHYYSRQASALNISLKVSTELGETSVLNTCPIQVIVERYVVEANMSHYVPHKEKYCCINVYICWACPISVWEGYAEHDWRMGRALSHSPAPFGSAILFLDGQFWCRNICGKPFESDCVGRSRLPWFMKEGNACTPHQMDGYGDVQLTSYFLVI